jgi:hypothetical protein
MHVAKQAIDEVQVSCNNIIALIEAIDVTHKKEETLTYTSRIQDNINTIKNSLILIDTTLDDSFNKIGELEHTVLEIVAEFDDIDMEGD